MFSRQISQTSVSAMLRRLTLIFALLTVFAVTGCAKKTKDEGNTAYNSASADDNVMGDSDSGHAMGLQTVHFGYDSSTMDADGKSTAKANADILKNKGSLKVQIEGHCDARGGIQYNIALGEKRANAVKKYLEDQGVAGERITTISYGKERPLDTGTSEDAYAKNRRANFAVTAK